MRLQVGAVLKTSVIKLVHVLPDKTTESRQVRLLVILQTNRI